MSVQLNPFMSRDRQSKPSRHSSQAQRAAWRMWPRPGLPWRRAHPSTPSRAGPRSVHNFATICSLGSFCTFGFRFAPSCCRSVLIVFRLSEGGSWVCEPPQSLQRSSQGWGWCVTQRLWSSGFLSFRKEADVGCEGLWLASAVSPRLLART